MRSLTPLPLASPSLTPLPLASPSPSHQDILTQAHERNVYDPAEFEPHQKAAGDKEDEYFAFQVALSRYPR